MITTNDYQQAPSTRKVGGSPSVAAHPSTTAAPEKKERRRVGRWSEEETKALIAYVNQV